MILRNHPTHPLSIWRLLALRCWLCARHVGLPLEPGPLYLIHSGQLHHQQLKNDWDLFSDSLPTLYPPKGRHCQEPKASSFFLSSCLSLLICLSLCIYFFDYVFISFFFVFIVFLFLIYLCLSFVLYLFPSFVPYFFLSFFSLLLCLVLSFLSSFFFSLILSFLSSFFLSFSSNPTRWKKIPYPQAVMARWLRLDVFVRYLWHSCAFLLHKGAQDALSCQHNPDKRFCCTCASYEHLPRRALMVGSSLPASGDLWLCAAARFGSPVKLTPACQKAVRLQLAQRLGDVVCTPGKRSGIFNALKNQGFFECPLQAPPFTFHDPHRAGFKSLPPSRPQKPIKGSPLFTYCSGDIATSLRSFQSK